MWLALCRLCKCCQTTAGLLLLLVYIVFSPVQHSVCRVGLDGLGVGCGSLQKVPITERSIALLTQVIGGSHVRVAGCTANTSHTCCRALEWEARHVGQAGELHAGTAASAD